jgi:hypothetical protein
MMMETGKDMGDYPGGRVQHHAYECKEQFTPDGKKLVSRERKCGPSLVSGAVTIVALLVGLILVLNGHEITAGTVTVGGLLKAIKIWYKQ